ncbi:MAG: choice-of-anchor D domain-containing protein, partial [Actinomycetota bacterium]
MSMLRIRRIRSIVLLLALLAGVVAGGGARAATSFEGIFQIAYGDSLDFQSGWQVYSLTEPGGSTHAVDALPSAFDSSPDSLHGDRVRIEGFQDAQGTVHASDVQSAESPGEGPGPAITGSTAWAVLLCKYSDIPAETNPLAYYNSLMDGTYPRMDNYWRAQSYNLINLTGTASYGWFTLPQTQAYYTNPANTDSTNLTNLSNDCTAAANPTVNFSPFYGIIVMVNGTVTGGAGGWGGGRYMTLDGVTKTWPFAWMPSTGHRPGVLGHEMGHGYGLPHSSALPYAGPSDDYHSDWDIMSSGFWTEAPGYAPYTSVGTGTISLHRDRLGWIAGARKFAPASGTETTITLWPLNDPLPGGSQYQMSQIPIPSSTHFYTVEARKKRIGTPYYDNGIPSEGIVLHEVNPDTGGTGRSADALVVDLDGDYTANPDPGEVWVPGETFVDAPNRISVAVLSANPDGSYQVRIGRDAAGVTVSHTGGSTQVFEGGATDTYTIVLNSQPTASVTVTPAHAGGQVTLSGAVTFTTVNWNVPQSVTVTAVNDTTPEPSPHSAVITHTASSADPIYAGIPVAALTASVIDNDPGASVSPASLVFGNQTVGTQSTTQTVTVTSSGGGTLVIGAVTIAGTDFVKTSDGCSGQSKPPGTSCTIGVAFAPGSTGAKVGTLSIPHNGIASPAT